MLRPSDPLGAAGVIPRGEQEPQIALILELAQRGTTPGRPKSQPKSCWPFSASVLVDRFADRVLAKLDSRPLLPAPAPGPHPLHPCVLPPWPPHPGLCQRAQFSGPTSGTPLGSSRQRGGLRLLTCSQSPCCTSVAPSPDHSPVSSKGQQALDSGPTLPGVT